MALIKCSDCGKDVSDKAEVCPFCANPIKIFQTGKKSKILYFLGLLSIIVGLISLAGKQPNVAVSFLVIGFVILIIGKIGIWWTRG